MKRRAFIKKAGFAGMILLVDPAGKRSSMPDDLEAGFLHPPPSAHPYAYWFWMNGHVSREGITLDLEAMKEIGISGVFNFDAGTGIPKGPVEYFSNEWLELKKHAMQEAERLGLEFTMHNCPGFSASGGPWITPALAMQQVTWSETYAQGGKAVDLSLPKPNSKLNFYKDIAVLAFPSLKEEELMQSVKISTSEGPQDLQKLNGNGAGIIASSYLLFEFAQPFDAQLITFYIAGVDKPANEPETGEKTSVNLEASVDGKIFYGVTPINTGIESELLKGDKYIVYDFPAESARFWRISTTKSRRFRRVQFSGIERLHQWLEKTNVRPRSIMRVKEASGIEMSIDQQVNPFYITKLDSIIDITRYMDKDGGLHWSAPSGNWTIIRIGYTPTGATIQAAPDKGQGLECDKFSKAAIRFHFDKMMEKLLPLAKSLSAKAKFGLEIDSYEAGMQNWTAGFEKEFEKRTGYSLLKYLPVLTGGRIIDSVDITERFAWDIRRIQADLMAENYYGHFFDLCKQHNIISYVEPYDSGPMEEMQIGAKADINMGEFWYGISTAFPALNPVRRTPKLAASIAQLNGQQITGAEAFTAEPDASRWLEYPFALKVSGDNAFTQGINRLIIHRFAHQPHPTAAPGMTMGPWGIHFDRTNTWWKQAKGYMQYLQRCQFLLQQGQPVADLLYFTGEDANMYTRASEDLLYPGSGMDYHLATANTVLNDITIKDNRIYLKNGQSYAMFVIQNFKAVSLPVMERLLGLVKQGMVLVGERPERSPGLAGYTDNDEKFRQVVHELFGEKSDAGITKRKLGAGHVFWSNYLDIFFDEIKLPRDFICISATLSPRIRYTHRKTADADIYFVSNQKRSFEELNCFFRIKNKLPEIWDPATGNISPATVFENTEKGIRATIQLEPYGSVFIIFRKDQPAAQLQSVAKEGKVVLPSKYDDYGGEYELSDFEGDFTITFWAKPEMNILLSADVPADNKAQVWTDFYVVKPWSLKGIYDDKYASCGITVGRNGIALWEQEADEPYMVLALPLAIEGWTHFAIRFTNNIPVVFVNGKMVKQGEKSRNIVSPPVYFDFYSTPFNDYKGDLGDLRLHKLALTDASIADLSIIQPTFPVSPFRVQLAGSDKPALLINENGNYQLNYSNGKKEKITISDLQKNIQLTGPWRVQFPTATGAPSSINLPALISLHRHPDKDVKYFSGTATYSTSFFIPKNSMTGKTWLLDLGQVEVIAEVAINGKSLGILWKRPYQIDISKAIRKGANQLEIKVTNLWTNRLIGDEQLPDPYTYTPGGGASGILSLTGGGIEKLPDWYINREPKPADGRITFTTWKHYTRDAPLTASGLIGPVTLIHAVTISV
jgi:hypothetical protein